MRHFHLFEFGDQTWFPQAFRDAGTAYLAVAYRLVPFAAMWAAKISTVLRSGDKNEILDLCSGSGGAMPDILDELERRGYDTRATLTDLYPNPNSAPHPRIKWLLQPVEATHVPPELPGVRTMFAGCHHFRPAAAKAILKDAFDQGRTLCIFESGSGSLGGAVSMLLVPLLVTAVMPFVRPFHWSYFVFTYLIPVLPLVMWWDGTVSMLRVYSPEQMQMLTADLRRTGYEWEIGRLPVRGLPYLIGRPV